MKEREEDKPFRGPSLLSCFDIGAFIVERDTVRTPVISHLRAIAANLSTETGRMERMSIRAIRCEFQGLSHYLLASADVTSTLDPPFLRGEIIVSSLVFVVGRHLAEVDIT